MGHFKLPKFYVMIRVKATPEVILDNPIIYNETGTEAN